MSEYGKGSSTAGAVGEVAGAADCVVVGDGEPVGRGSAEVQPEKIMGRTARKKVIQLILDIVIPFQGFEYEPNGGED
jgi:hypothetical protein